MKAWADEHIFATSVAWSFDGELLATAFRQQHLETWSVARCRLQGSLHCTQSHGDPAVQIAFSPQTSLQLVSEIDTCVSMKCSLVLP